MGFLPTLSGPVRKPALGGKPKQLVVLLHGVGADGNDLIGLAPYWAPALPDAEFVSADAILAGVRAAAPILDAFLDDALAQRGLDASKLALVGFSQGTMMSLYVGPRRAKALAGIVGYSGALIGADTLAQDIRSRPPVLLVHGDADQIVPPQAFPLAVAGLKAAGVAVEELICPGVAHSIDEAGLRRGGEFLRRVLAT